jgi:hypothetical protein
MTGRGQRSPGTRIGRAGPDVGQHRLARQLRDLASASLRAAGTPYRQRRTWRPVLRLRACAHA